jgi:tetratricopeptide (TPR) repeat protein
MDKYHNEDFDEALQLARKIRHLYPNEPAGAFGLLNTYQTIMRNYRVRLYESKFDSLLNLSIDLAENAAKKDKKDGKNYFYLGCAYGSRSMYHAQRGKWFDAFKDGTQISKNFNKALTYEPEFYDSHYGIGLYKYWLGAKAKVLNVLPFTNDNRYEGIEHMKLAIEKAQYLNVDGMYGLTAVYYNEGQFEKALELSDKVYERYPKNPAMLYRRGRILQALSRWQEAIAVFENLHSILETTPYQSISYQVECLFHMANSHYQLGSYGESQRLCAEAVALEKTCDFSKETDGPLEKFADIKKQLFELDDKVKSLVLTQANRGAGSQ